MAQQYLSGKDESQPRLVRHESDFAEERGAALAYTLSRVPTAIEAPQFDTKHELLLIFVVVNSQLLTQAALAASIAPLHVIGSSFNTDDAGQLSWIPAAYSLTVGTFILPAGRWGDLCGHKKVFIVGCVWFGLWSLISGFVTWGHYLAAFDFCRGMQGIGPALMLPNSIAILARIYPPGRKKERIIAIFGAAAPTGFILGALFSSLLATYTWWPWAYWVLGIYLFVLAGFAVTTIPDLGVAGASPSLAEFDCQGTILGVAGMVLINFAWNQGAAAGWQHVYVYVALLLGFILFCLFLLWELKRAEFPIIPFKAFTLDTSLVLGCIAAGWASFGIWIYYLWQYLEVVQGNSMLLSVAKTCPIAISGSCAAAFTAFVIQRWKPGYIMLLSMISFCVGTVLIATDEPTQTYWAQVFMSTVIASWGMDTSFPAGVLICSAKFSQDEQGLAASLINTVVNYSISIGLGMAGTIEAQIEVVKDGELAKYRGAWYLGIGLCVLGVLLSFGLIMCDYKSTRSAQTAEQESFRNP